MSPRPILITAFEGFTTKGGHRIDPNPTQRHAEALVARHHGAGIPLISQVLPVSFARTKATLLDHFETWRPAFWLGLGIAGGRRRIDLEALGLNIEHATGADNDDDSPTGRPIVPDGPLALPSTLDCAMLADSLSTEGLPVQVSYSAGTFLCNQALYLGCHAAASGQVGGALFVHIPLHGLADGVVDQCLDRILARCTAAARSFEHAD